MNVTRTPDSCFAGLEDYPFEPNYVDIDGLWMHYVDEGPSSAEPVLMLHGEPTWSYLYRHMIPVCARAGNRVIAPDLIGFGKSDKPAETRDYSYQRHVDWMTRFIEVLDLTGITLFCQDWGSLIGLRIAAENEHRFERIVDFGCVRSLTPAERRAYDAPFAAPGSKAGARIFPRLVPLTARNPAIPANRATWRTLGRWEKPFLTVFSDRDPITRGVERSLQRHVPGAAGQPHAKVRGGHFLQEDASPELARRINELIASGSSAAGEQLVTATTERGVQT